MKLKSIDEKKKYDHSKNSDLAFENTFIFDLYRKNCININMINKNGSQTIFVDFIDHSQSMTLSKANYLLRLTEDLVKLNFADMNGSFLDVKTKVNIWTHRTIKNRLEDKIQEPTRLELKEFDFKL